MSFKLLKLLISNLKKSFRCPSCGKGSLKDDFIFVMATGPSPTGEGYNALILATCSDCGSQSFVVAETKTFESRILGSSPISSNDILDMHNFLKGFQGDMKELFKEI